MPDALDTAAYDALVTAAETYRAALTIRLAGEAGLRADEIGRVTSGHLREAAIAPGHDLLAVPSPEEGATPNGAGGSPDTPRLDRETVVPASLAAELRRYADIEEIGEAEPFVSVSARRIQMIVRETAVRAAAQTDGTVDPDVTTSDLRHTFARRLLVDRGVDPHAVREAGGWETTAALDPYLDPLDGQAIAEAVAGSSPDRDEREYRIDTEETADADRAAPAGIGGFEAIAAGDGDSDARPISAVPRRLATADRWAEAWVVREPTEGSRVDVAASAGIAPAGLRERGIADGGPWQEALEGTAAITDGHPTTAGRPAVAVPVRYEDVTHGSLCVVVDGDRPVDAAERRTIEVLGRSLGWAVTARRWRELLHSDAVTEVTFQTTDDNAFLVRASAALDCQIELSSTVTVTDDASRLYLSVTGARPQGIADVVDGLPGVSDLRLIETDEDSCSVSVQVTGGSAVQTLTDHGATVRDAMATDGRVRVIADLPEGTDVRPVADGFRRAFTDARLVSKESVARSPRTESSLREGIKDRFTDRQWTALSAAYHGGYFDWPRGSTAEEVADAMDVSSPTFHNHLRKAQRALLDGLFEDERRLARS
ncbi:bacterio-opsin activator domain-containing protein [Halorubrum laminariae]|uniref:Bacterio-opsin activator domain-containing protein n=1 Tax=Halorubrum laminariae TaxID=1433523 RepID=A0ABD6C1A0_9EURY|nr:bacterio-opsin activator domain-containing protein [Halorubrum laminariae]